MLNRRVDGVSRIAWFMRRSRRSSAPFDRSNLIFTRRSERSHLPDGGDQALPAEGAAAALRRFLVPAPHDHERRRALRRHRERLARPPGAAHAQGLRAEARRRAPGSGPPDGSPDELDDAGPKGAELPRPGARRRPVPADVLRRAAPRCDAGASPAAAELHRALLRAGAADRLSSDKYGQKYPHHHRWIRVARSRGVLHSKSGRRSRGHPRSRGSRAASRGRGRRRRRAAASHDGRLIRGAERPSRSRSRASSRLCATRMAPP